MEEILYADLVTAIGTNALVPGTQYVITDYQTTYYIYEYSNTGYPWALSNTNTTDSGTTEPIVVLALTNNSLHIEAKSQLFPGDVLYYTIENIDAGVFASATGTITRRIDCIKRIDMPYDFRSVEVSYDSTLRPSLPSSCENVQIGVTASIVPSIGYTKTIPVLVLVLAMNVKIDVVNEDAGLLMALMYFVTIKSVKALLGPEGSLEYINLESIEAYATIGAPGFSLANFSSGNLTNLPNRIDGISGLTNPSLYSTFTKIAINGGYFMELLPTGSEIKCVYTP